LEPPGRRPAAPDDPVEAAWLARVRAGDDQAFGRLVAAYGPRLYRLAYRMTGNVQDAEDVVQETFLRAYRRLGRFEARASVATWLHRIAVNCAVDVLRTRRDAAWPRAEAAAEQDGRPAEPAARDADPDRLALGAELRARVAAALDQLSPQERAAFVLRHFEGWSIAEIGRALNLRASATKHSIFRAVRKLRSALEPFVADPPPRGDPRGA
jgi:RNA polymerase sigma-70 factor (ECF subfamily)